jgi:sugar lactone lactonase YvrE
MLIGAEQLLVTGENGILVLNTGSGSSRMLVDKADDVALVGVNEMATHQDGSMYFGSLDPALMDGKAPAPASIYRLDAGGQAIQVASGLRFSNGLAVSPDGKRLYHNETFVGTSVYEIASDGSLSEPTLLIEKPDCDGMAMDAEGTVWITGWASNAITCLRPDGSVKELIDLPAGGATCVRFGGADLRDVYVTTLSVATTNKIAEGKWPDMDDSVLFRARSPIAGLKTAKVRVRSVCS